MKRPKEFKGHIRRDNQCEEKNILIECERKECCCVIQSPGEQSLLLRKNCHGSQIEGLRA